MPIFNTNVQRWCVWSAVGFCALFALGYWVLAGLVPPPSPLDTAGQVAAFYSHDTGRLRAGLLVVLLGCPLLFPFVTVISIQMKRMEGDSAPLAWTQFASGAVGVLIFVLPIMVMQAAAFRPDREPAVTQGLNDVAWVVFLGTFSLAVLQNVVIAAAIFRDHRPEPVLPRWVGYFTLWCAVGFVPGGFTVFVKSGPLAWPGVFTFWVPTVVLMSWITVMVVTLLKAIEHEERERHASRAPEMSGST
jgi:hypothetical protein